MSKFEIFLASLHSAWILYTSNNAIIIKKFPVNGVDHVLGAHMYKEKYFL